LIEQEEIVRDPAGAEHMIIHRWTRLPPPRPGEKE
jgi:hypothetical protein